MFLVKAALFCLFLTLTLILTLGSFRVTLSTGYPQEFFLISSALACVSLTMTQPCS